MYDKDGSGTIELREMVEIVSTLYDMEGVGGVSQLPTQVSLHQTPILFRLKLQREPELSSVI